MPKMLIQPTSPGLKQCLILYCRIWTCMEAQIANINSFQRLRHFVQEPSMYRSRNWVSEEVAYFHLIRSQHNILWTSTMHYAGVQHTNRAYSWLHLSQSGFITPSCARISPLDTQPCCIASCDISFHNVARHDSKSAEMRTFASLPSMAYAPDARRRNSALLGSRRRDYILCTHDLVSRAQSSIAHS
jgi:hypothetical protein